MSWFDRRRALAGLAALALAAGCGFRPAYAPGGKGTALEGQVKADDPTNRDGFLLVEALERRLGVPRNPRYRLSYSLSISSSGLGINSSASTTRYHLVGKLSYTLRDAATGETLDSGEVESFTAYSTTAAAIADDAAATGARERLITILADKLVARLLTAPL
ncbi:LPS-assembly lipoprotein [Meinhardsimonia xiamenensis]|jgi:LPS-assembly lipoprotein|uniref:LPS-assembly lipoprotein n=1 Tax=Meinhardsimonia xiamenensis TaxID=990712 RepID=A0A1G9E7B5_9RHOB|nr:LPS assembly lipoprotein LptE [Meinhardsimonia xiamenensis]PRX33897.1 LPS-assembly lipoprotein [Meinhardsimonia xiamenensis]SDK72022.1 LPS-assembly lipoprotein [Meinhardsimonia xiamenensis]